MIPVVVLAAVGVGAWYWHQGRGNESGDVVAGGSRDFLGAIGNVWENVVLQPRGIRNHNPGNIRVSADQWQGAVGDDGEFVRFASPQHGLRALARVLHTYWHTHGLRTVRDIIERWAPPVENNTDAYVSHVASALGVDPKETLEPAVHLVPLMRAVIRHENGAQPYTDRQIRQGALAAGWDVSGGVWV